MLSNSSFEKKFRKLFDKICTKDGKTKVKRKTLTKKENEKNTVL